MTNIALRTRRVVALFVLVALFVVGCATPRAPERKAPRVVAGTSGNYPPLSVTRGERYEGFVPSLVGTFAAARNVEVTWTRFAWSTFAADMAAGRFDIAADGVTVRPERSIAGRFTVPIARGGAVLLLRRPAWAAGISGDSPRALASALDRPELRVAVNRGAHLERVTRSIFHAADVRTVDDNAVRDAFARGDVDAAMTNTFEAPRWAAGLAGVEHVGPLTVDVTALWVRAEREDLAVALDDFLLAEEESGRLGALRTKEIGEGAGPKAASVPSALFAAIAERLAIMPYVAAAKQRAGLPIEDRGQEAKVLDAARAEVAKASRAGGHMPSSAAIDAFFRAQIAAAKAVQTNTAPSSTEYTLDRELRPAIARITARQARLVVRVPRGLDVSSVTDEAKRSLEGIDAVTAAALAEAIVALGQ